MTDITPSALNIVNGDMAAGTFLHAFGPSDRLLIQRDVLTCGPIARCTKIALWQKVRLHFWQRAFAHLRNFNFEPSPIDLLKHAERLRGPELPCVWAATGNSDQFTISFVLHLVTVSGGDVNGMQVVQFEKHAESGARVRGTGELAPDQLRSHPQPRTLSLLELAAYRDAWVALTSPDPADVVSFSSRHPDAPWYLREAVDKVLRRYPDRATGLNFWDRHLLESVRNHGPKAADAIANTIEAMFEDGDLVGDLYTFSRLLGMTSSGMPQPLLNFSGSRQHIGRAEVTLTELGARVLDGSVPSYSMNPVDDWAGGVHLSSAKGSLWLNDNGAIVRA